MFSFENQIDIFFVFKENQVEERKPDVNKNVLPLSAIIPKLEPEIPQLMNLNNIKQESKKDIAIYTSS